jgi:hypothetical protein
VYVAIDDEIKQVLLERWDPLGIRAEPAEHVRYDCFVQDLTLLLVGGGSDADVRELLRSAEIDRLGLGRADEHRVDRAARALREIAPTGADEPDRSPA